MRERQNCQARKRMRQPEAQGWKDVDLNFLHSLLSPQHLRAPVSPVLSNSPRAHSIPREGSLLLQRLPGGINPHQSRCLYLSSAVPGWGSGSWPRTRGWPGRRTCPRSRRCARSCCWTRHWTRRRRCSRSGTCQEHTACHSPGLFLAFPCMAGCLGSSAGNDTLRLGVLG